MSSREEDLESSPLEGIAVVGMAGRFPGADDLAALWRNLCGGVEGITFYTREELAASGVDPALLDDPRYVKAGAALRDVQSFDAAFFGFSAREAELMDPQHRLFLECSWEALENAGYDTAAYSGSIGVFAGMGVSGYLIRNLLSHDDLLRSAGPLQVRIFNDNNFLTSLAAWKLDLRGPTVTVQSACSTSLVAACMASQSLLQYQCDMALAGGVSVVVPHAQGYLAQESVLSPDGHCRAFDAAASGTVEGSGAGVVVLKRLSDALAEGDAIHAVIRGFATNNDGGFKQSFTAPSLDGQLEVVAMAQAMAGVPAESVTYVETHGTGTPLGDPVEVAALTEAFAASTEQRGFCALGSIKTNIGHLDAAAGAAGLIKAVLAVEHGVLPPSLHFETPNPRIDFAASPFYVNTECRPWRPEGWPRRAGVSAFAIGGVNAHLILEEPPAPEPAAAAPPWSLLVLSARTETALDAATGRLLDHLKNPESQEDLNLADIAYTLQVGRRAFRHRRVLVGRDLADAVGVLERRDPRRLLSGVAAAGEPQVAFLFPGLGTEYAGMARGLYRDDAGFRARLDDCAERLASLLGLDLREVLFPEDFSSFVGEGLAPSPTLELAPGEGAAEIDLRGLLGRSSGSWRTAVSQPAVFAVEYALASRLLDWGIRPQAMVGFSLGEYVAACLSGVLSLDDALRLVAGRARLIDELPGGAMLAVPLGEEAVAPWIAAGLSLAVVAGPELTVLAGTEETVAAAGERLTAAGHVCRRLQTSHAFHSALMEPAVERFLALFEGIELHPPEIPYLSNVTGGWITAEEATDPAYWAEHLRGTVRFADAVAELWREPGRVLVEVGPGQTLSSWALQQSSVFGGGGGADPVALPTLRHAFERTDDLAFLLQTVGRLWLTGLRPDWPALWADQPRRRVPLPTYPFERQRYWIEPRSRTAVHPVPEAPVKRPAEETVPAAEPARRHARPSLHVPYAAPRDAAERRVVEILGELLRLETVGIHDSFFDLGGDSLLATHLVARLHRELGAELSLRDIFESPTAAELTAAVAAHRRVGTGGAGAWGPVLRRTGGEPPPLSFAQRRLWFLEQLDPGNPAYNVPAAVLLTGPLDRSALAAALEEVAARHEALRTTFGPADGGDDEPVQRIAPPSPLPFPGIDLSGLPEAARESEALRLAAGEMLRPFDLVRGPLLRAALLRLGAVRHVALFTMHHMVGDGWSSDLLVRELAALYPALAEAPAGRPSPLPLLPVQYADFVLWQRDNLRGAELEAQLAFWRGALAGAPAVLDLPSDRPRPVRASGRGGAVASALSAERAEALKAVGRQAGATPFMTFLAAFYALLHRLTGETDLVVGTPVANRRRPELEGLIGFFVNTLALRVQIPDVPAGEPTFAGLLAVVREAALSAYAHQDLPFERLVEELAPERSLARTPLFQVMFLLHGTPVEERELAGLTLAPFGGLATAERAAKFDLTLELIENGPDLTVLLEFRRDLFDPVTAVRLLGHFAVLAGALAAAPEARLAELPLLTAAERQQLVVEWNDTQASAPAALLHQAFEAQAAAQPTAPALVCGGEMMTYGDLDARADRLARRLRSLGVGPEVPVAVCAGRSAGLVAALLAVLKAGGAYLPLDPNYPPERLAFLLADAGAAVLLTESALAGRCGAFEGAVVELDRTDPTDRTDRSDAPLPPPLPGSLAYLIYTSGSTGRPKGVAIPHGAAVALVRWAAEAFSPAELDGVLASTSICFDLSVFELFVPLSRGGRVILAENALELPRLAADVRLVNTVPSAMGELVRMEAIPPSVRTVGLAGEPLRRDLVQRIYAAAPGVERVLNLYGPSETTTYSTWTVVERGEREERGEPSIGRPITGTRAHVLDGSLAPVPIGVSGELFLGGAGLARGYLGRPELTAKRFVPEPFGGFGGSRLYHTGDRARWRSDGALELLGRMDHQVKVRGFRIELGEIEAVLAGHPAVREAAVTAPATPADASGDRRLVAYVSATEGGGPLDAAALGVYLGSRLPSFMVPSMWVELAALPRTRTGKVDRQALPVPGEMATGAAYEAPRTATEEMLAGIWGDLLRRERVGAHDNFFALGGHSLLATRVVSRLRDRLGVELPVRALFEQPTVAGLAVLLADHHEGAGVGVAQAPPIPALPRDAEGGGTFPASFAQRRLWFFDQLEPGSAVYNMPLALSLEGELAEEQLAAVFGELARRHETLRTTFIAGDDGPLQVVHPAAAWPFALESIDLSALGEEERRRELTRRVAAESLRPFDLASGPLLRATLVRLAARENALLLTLHHVISDGWSMGALVREVTALYAAAMAGWRGQALGEVLPPLPVQYADFTMWQSRRLSGETLAREIEHWREKLAGAPAFLELPTDRPRPLVQTFGGRSLPLWLEPGLTSRLSALALATGTTLFMVLLAGFETLLGIYSGAQDLAVGTPIAGRNRAELEGLIGFFVNSLVLRADLSGDPSFVDLLGRVREDTLSGYAHQDLPFEKLVEEVKPERSRAHSPIFQVMFALQNAPLGEGNELPGLTMRPIAPTPGSETPAKYDLTLSLTEGGEGIQGSGGIGGSLEYNVDLFDAPTMVRLLDHWRALLEGVVADPGARLSALPLLGAVERQHLLREWSDAAPVGGRITPVHELFAAEAARRPDAVALVSGHQVLTYGELARRSSRMARRLTELGVGPGMLVGLCAERSPELILGVLAILAAGGAYLPLDPSHPMERLAYTLADAGAPILLAEESLHERLPAGAARVVGLHALASLAGGPEAAGEVPPPLPHVDPGDLAYVIYTSGSTGWPKGVEVSHANAARLFAVIRQNVPFGPGDVWTLFHSIAFDFSVWELWGALAFGGRLVLVPSETARSTEAFYDLLRRERVTVLSQTPSAFRQLLWAEESALARNDADGADDADDAMVSDLRPLRLIVFGGEALDPASLAPWFERHGEELPLLVNMYGITETTVHTTWRRLRQSDLSQPGSTVGRPLSDLSLYLLDRGGRPVPIGVPGEIHVGGAGVARGYLARPALTAERFVPDPFSNGRADGQRLYRSGDLARWRPDGDLEYLGRIDRQVKVRGFRIELGEIEAALAEHPGVREAAVVAREDRPGDVRLVGYVSSAAEADPAPQALAAFLAERLPGYMVPAAWVLLDRLPLTANGKVDRAALPAPAERGEGGAYVAPRSPVEEVLAGIWEEVLELKRVGVEDDFFALGGHSLGAAQVISRVLKAFSVELPLRLLFEHPTVAALAGEVERLRGSGAATGASAASAAPPLVRAPRGTEAPLSFRQEWRWLIDQLSPDSIGNRGHNVPLALTLRGAVSAPALAAALAAEVERHESLRTRFVSVGGKPVQRIDPPCRPPLPFVDLGGLPPAAAQREAARLGEAEWTFPFDIARGPLLHSLLLRLEKEVFVLLLTLHHIISDGWSMHVLGRELPALYRAAQAGLPSPLPELPIQFRDFAIWQRGWLQGEALDSLLRAAVARLAGMPRLDLPLDRPYFAQRYSSSSGLLPFGLDAALTDSLSALSRRQGASLFMTVLAAFTGLLRRHTGRGDFPVAIISAGRTRAELEPLVGYFTNTLVIRAAAEGDPSFGELLARTRGATLAAYDHQDLPFSFLVEALRAEGPGGPPLFEVLFLLQPQGSEVAAPDADIAAFPVVGTQAQDFALVLDLVEAGGGLIGTFSHNQALFDSTTALRWRGHLEALLAGVAADPTRPLTELPLLSEGERHQVTFEWGEAVHVDGGPAPMGIWGELAGAPAAPAGRRARRLADGTLEVSAPAPAGLAEPAEAKAAPASAAPAPIASKGPEPARSLESLSATKRKLLAKRIRGER